EYLVELPVDVQAAVANFRGGKLLREREGKQPVEIDLGKAVADLRAAGPNVLRFTLRAGQSEAVARPSELLGALFGEEHVRPGVARLVRENVVFGPPR
ncbi:MAG TPA: hypothetical protein VLW85_10340, partial [Myxococcales bacterium]|nr:hypothetical protein [Myxococcales bacterium]